MDIMALGVGSAFSMINFQTNLMVTSHNDKRLLIDAGTDIRFSLKTADLTYKDIDAVYISHLHADHVGGLEYLAFCSFFDPNKEKIKLYGNYNVISAAWNNVLSGGLSSIQNRVMSLEDYFEVESINNNCNFLWEDILFTPIQTVHIMNGYSIVPSYGLMISDQDKDRTIFVTTDTQFNPEQIKDFYRTADYIIQDCETMYKSGVHAHYDQLATLSPGIKKKMILIHYNDNVDDDFRKRAIDDGFMGFADQSKIIL